jgi:hypothetical protein
VTQRTARRPAGTLGATAPSAGVGTATPSEPGDGPERICGYQSRYGNSSVDAIYAGQPFRAVLRDLGLTPNQVWGLTKTDVEWSKELEAALTATRRDDLEHGTNAAYVAGCVCRDCREHERVRMARNRQRQYAAYQATPDRAQ